MIMTGQQRIAAPRQRVWQALNDPDTLRASIPGCQSLTKESDTRFTATVEVKVGPIGARFKGAVALADIDPANGYTLMLEGNGGIAGTAKGAARVRLSDDGGGTLIAYEVDAQVGGRMAQLGGPIIDATAKQLAGKFFGRFGEVVTGEVAPAAAAVPGVAPAPVVAPVTAPARGFPAAWVFATVIAALVGFLVGRGQGGVTSDWAGLAIGLMLLVVAFAGFEYGRRASATTVVLDSAQLRRLLDGVKE